MTSTPKLTIPQRQEASLRSSYLVEDGDSQMTCTCPFAKRMLKRYGIHYCEHIRRLMIFREDMVPNGLQSIVFWYDGAGERPYWIFFMIGDFDNQALRSVTCSMFPSEFILGYIHADASRLDVWDVAVPYLIERASTAKCVKCGSGLTWGGRTGVAWGDPAAAAALMHHRGGLCFTCNDLRDLAPQL